MTANLKLTAAYYTPKRLARVQELVDGLKNRSDVCILERDGWFRKTFKLTGPSAVLRRVYEQIEWEFT